MKKGVCSEMVLLVGAVDGAILLVDILYRWSFPVLRDTPLFGLG